MYHFLHKHRFWLMTLVALTVGTMIVYSVLTDNESDPPGQPVRNVAPIPAADGP
ncbi:MAG: hypothetical protein IT427_04900 [Pirellulales bacterium]|nr:hypothetical protein [Pirellulales bacterium]